MSEGRALDTNIQSLFPPDTGSKTTVYAQEPQEPLGVGEDSQVQYLIKWVNWSHLHNTWETGG